MSLCSMLLVYGTKRESRNKVLLCKNPVFIVYCCHAVSFEILLIDFRFKEKKGGSLFISGEGGYINK